MDEEIDATGSAGAMDAWQASLKSFAACGQVSITISGVDSSTVEVAEVSVSHFGDHPRRSDDGSSARLRGVEFIDASAGAEDVVLSFNFVATRSRDVYDGIKLPSASLNKSWPGPRSACDLSLFDRWVCRPSPLEARVATVFCSGTRAGEATMLGGEPGVTQRVCTSGSDTDSAADCKLGAGHTTTTTGRPSGSSLWLALRV